MKEGREEKPRFIDQLKEAGKMLHDEAENTAVIQAIFQGEISDEAYKDYLASLRVIYFQLERGITINRQLPVLHPLYIPELFRSGSIGQDLAGFGVNNPNVPEAAESYDDHLKELSDRSPHRLIAHYYLRFLGDLFGGQMMGSRLSGRFVGKLAFYDFTELCQEKNLSKPSEFARHLREIINALPLDEQQQHDILDEISVGYQLHLQLFKELEDRNMSNG